MSETKKMTKEEILEIFKGEYKSVLRKYERKVEKYAIEMNEDYEYFFRWHSDEMYKAQVDLMAVRELRPMTSLDDLDKIKTCLCNHIGNIEHTLIEGSQTPLKHKHDDERGGGAQACRHAGAERRPSKTALVNHL